MFEFLFASAFALNERFISTDITLDSVPQKKLETLVSQNLDGDLFVGKNDLCPNVAGRDQGCPVIKFYTGTRTKNWVVEIKNENFRTKEKTEIKVFLMKFISTI